jgi:hypothetical protein
MAVRAMALTALAARKGLGFFFFGTTPVNHKGNEGAQRDSKQTSAHPYVALERMVAIWIPHPLRGFGTSEKSRFVFLCALCGYDCSDGRARFF